MQPKHQYLRGGGTAPTGAAVVLAALSFGGDSFLDGTAGGSTVADAHGGLRDRPTRPPSGAGRRDELDVPPVRTVSAPARRSRSEPDPARDSISMLELHGATKSFGDVTAVHPTDLTFEGGETTVLIGPSGCGKSTILRLLMGLIEPDAGDVLFDGEPLDPERVLEVRRKMGYVIQGGGLFPHLTAGENIRLMPEQLGWDEERIRGRVDELVELTHFPKDGLDRYPLELSGGQQQRISLIRALMLDPEVVLFDEPLGALDPLIRAELQEELREIFETLDKTVVLVTHDMDEAAFFGGPIALMRDGRIVQKGTLQQLLEEPDDAFVSEFIRAQRSTLAEYEEQRARSDSVAESGGDP